MDETLNGATVNISAIQRLNEKSCNDISMFDRTESPKPQTAAAESLYMTRSLRMRQMCNAVDLNRVKNETYLQSNTLLQCMPGYQTVKTKYGTEAKPFFGSKNFKISTPFVKSEISPAG